MAHISQYLKGINYLGRAFFIYRSLRTYLKRDFFKDLEFPNPLEKDYFYHSSYYNRTQQYMHANHFFGELLCLLRDKTLLPIERKRFANLSSCAPIFDDFFDRESNIQHISELLRNPDIKNAQTDTEELAVLFLKNILATLENSEAFLNAAMLLFQAQKDSKLQKDHHLHKEMLQDISIRKGGYSGLMYAHLLNPPSGKDFLEMAYILGAYGQLMDDVFDLYDDAQEGIRTFANQSQNVKEIREIIHIHKYSIFSLLEKMNLENGILKHFSNVLAFFSSTIEIALSQYEFIERKAGISPIQCLQLPRKAWIVDMEKPYQIWKLFKLAAGKMK